jgi:hypothetical protein
MKTATSRPRGRPVLPEDERRTGRIEIRVTEIERRRLEALAAARELPVSEYLRRRGLSPRR